MTSSTSQSSSPSSPSSSTVCVRTQEEWNAWVSSVESGDSTLQTIEKLSVVPFGNNLPQLLLHRVRVTKELEILDACLGGLNDDGSNANNVSVLAKALSKQASLQVLKLQTTVNYNNVHPSALRILVRAVQTLRRVRVLKLQLSACASNVLMNAGCPVASCPELNVPLHGFATKMPQLHTLSLIGGKYTRETYRQFYRALSSSSPEGECCRLKELTFVPIGGYQIQQPESDDALVRMLQSNASIHKLKIAVNAASSLVSVAQHGLVSNRTLQNATFVLKQSKQQNILQSHSRRCGDDELDAFVRLVRNDNYALRHVNAVHWDYERACSTPAWTSASSQQQEQRLEFYLDLNRSGKRRYLTNACRSGNAKASSQRWMAAVANLQQPSSDGAGVDSAAFHYLRRNPMFWCPAAAV